MPSDATIMTADFICREGSIDACLGITAPVGLGARCSRCKNLLEDVRTVQRLLNRFPPLEGGPVPKLVPDGYVGPLTDKAIGHFQAKWDITPKYSTKPDHIVDPGGKTLDRLNEGPTGKLGMTGEFMKHIPRVLSVVSSARRSLSFAKEHLKNGSSQSTMSLFGESYEAAYNKTHRHFRLKGMWDPLRRLEVVDNIYIQMMRAIGHVPQGVILAMDEPPHIAESAYMFTWPGGYQRLTSHEKYKGLFKSSIYLCPKSKTLDRDAFVYAMIHELAHYVGPKEFKHKITDFSYFHRGANNYYNLSPALTLRNADCYSQFAYDAIGKNDFNVLTHQVH